MFITKSLSFLLLLSNNIRNYLSNDNDSFFNTKNSNAGNDERYDNEKINNEEEVYMLYKINRYIINKNIIEELEKNNTNIYKKLDIIEKYTDIYKNQNSIQDINLLAANLLEHFYDL